MKRYLIIAVSLLLAVALLNISDTSTAAQNQGTIGVSNNSSVQTGVSNNSPVQKSSANIQNTIKTAGNGNTNTAVDSKMKTQGTKGDQVNSNSDNVKTTPKNGNAASNPETSISQTTNTSQTTSTSTSTTSNTSNMAAGRETTSTSLEQNVGQTLNDILASASGITSYRPVIITSDNIVNVATDTNRVNQIIAGLKKLGLDATFYGLGPNTHYSVLSYAPANALVVDIYGGACAGTINEMGLNYYKQLVGNKKVYSIWLGPTSTDITGLSWLPKAWDDNFSPTSFTGLAHPDQYLKNNGYDYLYVTTTDSNYITTIVNAIYQEATGKTTTGGTTTPSITTYTMTQVLDASARVKTYIETNKRLPNYVTINNGQVSMPQFLQILVKATLQVNRGITTPITLENVLAPSNPQGSVSGNIYKTEYLDISQRVQNFITSNGIAPNYASSSLGNIQYQSLIYMYSKILNFYKNNNYLPNYVSMSPWTTTTSSSSSGSSNTDPALAVYLNPSSNCQSGNSQIIKLATSLTSGASSQYNKAVAIFNWVRNNINYSFYYNTQKGAVGTLNSLSGNCCDTTHLLVALCRAAGIPARYVNGYCQFTSGSWYGHVWAQVFVNNKWYTADAISSRNTFGVINNWNTATATIKGIYSSLPF